MRRALRLLHLQLPVAMAGGVWLAIEDVEEGDLVIAFDPETGEYGERKVLDLIEGEGFKDLVDVTVDDVFITATVQAV